MIVSTPVAAAVAARWDHSQGGLFPSRWENLVAGWCVKHYRKYGKAPGGAIETVFDRWATNGRNEDDVGLIETLLSGLSGEYERQRKRVNPDHTIDLAGEFFSEVKARGLKDQLDGLLEKGDLKSALAAIREFREVQVGTTNSWVDPFSDREAVLKAFESKGEPLFSWGSDALDRFFRPVMYRGEFLAMIGRAKIGKSFWLQEFMFMAMKAGVPTAFLEVGDQTQDQLIRRMGCRVLGRPALPQKGVKIPTGISFGEGGMAVAYDEKTWKRLPDPDRAAGAMAGAFKAGLLRLAVRPSLSATAADLDNLLRDWELEGFVPGLVIVDYPDILAPMTKDMKKHDQVGETWAKLRGTNQRLNCLMVVVTQADTDGYTKKLLTMENFANSRQINDHVTGMVGINQTEAEKPDGVYRLNMIHGRDLDFDSKTPLYCVGCVAIGRPAMFASF